MKKTNHDLAHEFQEWLEDENWSFRGTIIAWRGNEKEDFINGESYFRSRFRDWALLAGLPRKKWNAVFKEWNED